MGALDDVIRYKQMKDAERQAQDMAVPNAINTFAQAQQQAQLMNLKRVETAVTAAKAGLRLNPDNTLTPDESLQSSATRSAYSFNPVTGQLEQVGTIKKGDVVRNQMSLDDRKQVAETQRQAVTDNPIVNQDTQGAVTAYQYIHPRIEKINSILSKGEFQGDAFSRLAKQVSVGKSGELVVPDNSPLEDLVGALNEIKLTGFGLGGKNFTENEAKIIFGRLDPTGKSDKRFMSDIKGLEEFFKLKAEAGTKGLSDTRGILTGDNNQGSSNSGSGISPDLSNQAAQILASRRKK